MSAVEILSVTHGQSILPNILANLNLCCECMIKDNIKYKILKIWFARVLT